MYQKNLKNDFDTWIGKTNTLRWLRCVLVCPFSADACVARLWHRYMATWQCGNNDSIAGCIFERLARAREQTLHEAGCRRNFGLGSLRLLEKRYLLEFDRDLSRIKLNPACGRGGVVGLVRRRGQGLDETYAFSNFFRTFG